MKNYTAPVPQQRRSLLSIAVAVALAAQYGGAVAGPSGQQVVTGQVTVTRPDVLSTVINQASQSAIVNWQQFSVAANEKVDIRQPNASSVLLNRVIGNNPSEIYGRLSANGKVFLVNPNGVLFGRNAQVSVGGLVASTLDIANDDFLAGRFHFSGSSTASVDNQGSLQAAERGTIALLGGRVNNDGTISAQLGTAAMAAGEKIVLDFQGDGLTKIRVDQGAVAALVANRGMIIADGGQAVMSAHAAQALADTVLNQSGVVRARSLVERDGKIVLDGGAHGVTLNSGALDATGSAAGLKGGTINLLGHHVGVVGTAVVDASGDAGGGKIFVGGGVQGGDPLLRHAQASFVGPQAALRANALGNGHGGTVVVWSDGATRMYGAASATGGVRGGDGGFIETSGHFLDVQGARIDAAAARGKAGNWLLDPWDIDIVDFLESVPGVPGSPNFVSDGTSPEILNTDISDVLNAGTSVTVTTGPGGSSEGNINVFADIIKTAGGDASLTFNATNNINVASDITIASTSGALDINLNADADNAGGGQIDVGALTSLRSNGGSVRLYGQSDAVAGFASGPSSDYSEGIILGIDMTIDTRDASATGGNGNIVIRGMGQQGVSFGGTGVIVQGGALTTGAGSIAIVGIGSPGRNGVSLASPTISTTGGGSIDVRGLSQFDGSGFSAGIGLEADDATIFTSGGPGSITLTGESQGADGLSLSGGTIGAVNTEGNIYLRGYSESAGGSSGAMLMMPSIIETTGLVGLLPGGMNNKGELESRDSVAIDLAQSVNPENFILAELDLSDVISNKVDTVVIGSSSHTGTIRLGGLTGNLGGSYNLTLQNGGAGSGGIVINDLVDLSGRTLALSSGGAVVANGPLLANYLVLKGEQAGASFDAGDSGNQVNNLAVSFDQPRGSGPNDGNVRFHSSTNLDISAGGAWGTENGVPLALEAGDVLVSSSAISGNMTVTGGGDITMTVPLTMVADGAVLSVSAAGNINVSGPLVANGAGASVSLLGALGGTIGSSITMDGNAASLNINTTNALALPGTISLGGIGSNATFYGGDGLSSTGVIDMLGGTGTLDMQSAANIDLSGQMTVNGATQVTINASNTLNATGLLQVSGTGARVALSAGNALVLGGSTQLQGDSMLFTASANNAVTQPGGAQLSIGGAGVTSMITAFSGDLMLSGLSDFTGGGANVTFNSGNDVTLSATGSVNASVGNTDMFFIAERDVLIDGSISMQGPLQQLYFSAGNLLDYNGTSILSGTDASVSLDSIGALNVDGTITLGAANGQVSVSGGEVAVNGAIETGGDNGAVSILARNNATLAGSVLMLGNTSSANLNASGDLTVAPGGTISMNGTDASVTLGATNVTVAGTGQLGLAGDRSTLRLTASNTLDFGGQASLLGSGSSLTGTAGTNLLMGGAINSGGAFNQVSLSANTLASVDGSVTVGGPDSGLSISGGTGLTVGAPATFLMGGINSALTLTGGSGELNFGGTATISGGGGSTANLFTSGSAVVSGDIAVSGGTTAVQISADNTVTVTGSTTMLGGGNSLALSAAGDLIYSGNATLDGADARMTMFGGVNNNFTGVIDITGANGALTLTGNDTTLMGSIGLAGDNSVFSFTIDGKATFDGNVAVLGANAQLIGIVGGDLDFSNRSTVTMNGPAAMVNLQTGANLGLLGSLDVGGDDASTSFSATGDLNATGTMLFGGDRDAINFVAGNNVFLSGNTTLGGADSSLFISGTNNFVFDTAGVLTIGGDRSRLFLSGNDVFLSGQTAILGQTNFAQFTANANLEVSGPISVAGSSSELVMQATNGITASGPISASGDFSVVTISAGTDLTTTGGSVLDVTGRNAGLNLRSNGTLSANGAINLAAPGATLEVQSVGAQTLLGSINGTGDFIAVTLASDGLSTLGGSIDLQGDGNTLTVTGGTGVTLNSGSVLGTNGANSTISVTSVANDINLGSNVSMTGPSATLNVNAARDLSVAGTLSLEGSNAIISALAGNAMTVTGPTSVTGDFNTVNFSANGDASFAGDILVSGLESSVRLAGGATTALSGAVTVDGGSASLAVYGNDLSTTGELLVQGDASQLILQGTNSTRVGADVRVLGAASTATFSAFYNVFVDSTSLISMEGPNAALSLNSNAGNIDFAGVASITGGGATVALTAAANLTLPGSIDIAGGGSTLNMISAGDTTLSGTTTVSGGGNTFTVSAGNALAVNVPLQMSGDGNALNLTSGAALSLAGPVSMTGADSTAQISAGTDLVAAGDIVLSGNNSSLTIGADNALTLGGATSVLGASGALTISSGTDLVLNGATINLDGPAAALNLTSANALNFATTANVGGPNAVVNLTAGGSLSLSGTLAVGGDGAQVTLQSGTSTSIAGTIDVQGGGSALLVNADGALDVTSSAVLGMTGPNAALTLRANGGNLDFGGAASVAGGGATVSLSAEGSLTVPGSIDLAGGNATLTLDAVNNIVLSGAGSLGGGGNTLSVNAGNDVQLAAPLTLNGDGNTVTLVAGAAVNIGGPVSMTGADASLAITSGSAMVLPDAITLDGANANLDVTAVGNLTVDGTIAVLGDNAMLSLKSNASLAVGSASTLTMDGMGASADLLAGADVLLGGTIDFANAAEVLVEGANVTLAGSSVIGGDRAALTLRAVNAVNFTAPATLSMGGLDTTLTVSGTDVSFDGNADLAGDSAMVDISATGDLSIGGAISVTGDLASVIAGALGSSDVSGSINLLGAGNTLAITGNTGVGFTGDIVATGSNAELDLSSSLGDVILNGTINASGAGSALSGVAGTGLSAFNIGGDIGLSGDNSSIDFSSGGSMDTLGSIALSGSNSTFTLRSGGDLTLRGSIASAGGTGLNYLGADGDILFTQGSSVANTGGPSALDVNSDADSSGNGAIFMDSGSSITTGGGALRMYGQSNAAAGYATGSSSYANGITLSGATISTGSGALTMRGRGSLLTGEGTVNGTGILLDNSAVQSSTGALAMTGMGAEGGVGLSVQGSSIRSQGGAIDLRGRSGDVHVDSGATGNGLSLADAIVATTGAAALSLAGESQGASGIAMSGRTAIGGAGYTGNIVLRAFATEQQSGTPVVFALGDPISMLSLNGTLQTAGIINIRPGGVSTLGELTEQTATVINLGNLSAPGYFALSQAELDAAVLPGSAGVVIGSASHTGNIGYGSGGVFSGNYDLSLQNGGAGSGGISIYTGLSIPGRMLTLSTGGAVTQGAEIVAGRLLLHGTQPQSNFQLTNAGNSVGRLSAQFDVPKGAAATDGDVNFTNSGALEIGPMTGMGFNAATNQAVPVVASNAVVAGDLVLQTTGDLTLQQSISTLGSEITLVTGGAFLNPANATLTPGGGDRWRVFANSWVGEADGGLVGTAPNPNYYNCAFGAACMSLLPATGSYFVYRQQPVLNLTLVTPTQDRVYGQLDPLFPFTGSGLLNGDSLAFAATGSYTVPGGLNVGSHAVSGSFTSPVGYLINAAPGTLNVTPAMLTYVAAPSTRESGLPNAPYSGTVTGLVNGETLAGATTGTLVFTSPSPVVTPAGQYAINGGGLTARNYVFQQAPSNLTALTVTPARTFMPSIANNVSMPSSDLYGSNFGSQRACVGTGPLAGASGAGDANDTLAMEWSRVRESPNLSNCIGLAQRYSCGDF
jgi:filamentous hemagglutinin family protein